MKRLPLLIVITFICFSTTHFAYAQDYSDEYYERLKGILSADFGMAPSESKSYPITREEFISLVVKIVYGSQPPVAASSYFDDFSSITPSFSGYIEKAGQESVIAGVLEDGKCYAMPDKKISRQEAAVIIANALKLEGSGSPAYSDVSDIAVWALDGVSACQKAGIFAGYPDNTFKPLNNITWAESVTVAAQMPMPDNGEAVPAGITVVAGNGSKGTVNGKAELASFNTPTGVLVAKDIIYIADSGNNQIRKLKDGKVSALAGLILGHDEYDFAVSGFVNSSLEDSLFNRPVAVLPYGSTLLVLDSENHAIRQLSTPGVTTFAGGKKGFADGYKSAAAFNTPSAFCTDGKGRLYIADSGNNAIRSVDVSGNVTTIAKVNAPSGICWFDGALYVTCGADNKIIMVKNGTVTDFAGADTGIYDDYGNMVGSHKDGQADSAFFYNPTGICVSTDGTFYVADTGNGLVRKIENKTVTTLSTKGWDDNFVSPKGLFILENNLYIADCFKNIIVKITL